MMQKKGMRCLLCSEMQLKEFHCKTEIWTGYCMKLRQKVQGTDLCRYTEQYDLFQNII